MARVLKTVVTKQGNSQDIIATASAHDTAVAAAIAAAGDTINGVSNNVVRREGADKVTFVTQIDHGS